MKLHFDQLRIIKWAVYVPVSFMWTLIIIMQHSKYKIMYYARVEVYERSHMYMSMYIKPCVLCNYARSHRRLTHSGLSLAWNIALYYGYVLLEFYLLSINQYKANQMNQGTIKWFTGGSTLSNKSKLLILVQTFQSEYRGNRYRACRTIRAVLDNLKRSSQNFVLHRSVYE